MFSTPFTYLAPSSLYDPSAQAFIDAAGLTVTNQMTAINTLVVGLKNNNLWTKLHAFYPFVGGNATSHKFNLIDPRDVDAAYRIVWNGSITHSANGVAGNGSSYGDTKYAPSVALGASNSASLFLYARTTTANTAFDVDMGVYDNSTGNTQFSASANITYFGTNFANFKNTYGDGYPTTPAAGLLHGTFYVSGSNAVNARFLNGATAVSFNTAVSSLQDWPPLGGTNTNASVTILAQRAWPANTIGSYTTRTLSAAGFGQSMTAAEVKTFYDLVQAYQTALSRQV